MKRKLRSFKHLRIGTSTALLWVLYNGGCVTSVRAPLPPSPPSYTEVVHPRGMDLGDLTAVFTEENAPRGPEFSKLCDSDYRRLKALVHSKLEIYQGIAELVKKDPVKYHWCFYAKLLAIDDFQKSDAYVDQKQKFVLEIYGFLTPVAKAFMAHFSDSRYMRWAISRFQKVSERVFFRKLELTPEGTSILVQPSNPYGLWRQGLGAGSVLEKYHFNPEEPTRFQDPEASDSSLPVGAPSGIPDGMKMPPPTAPEATPEASGIPETSPSGVSPLAPSSSQTSTVETSPIGPTPVLVPAPIHEAIQSPIPTPTEITPTPSATPVLGSTPMTAP